VVSSLKQEGQGDLYAQFLKLKDKLEKEGLFNQKREIPFLPNRVGLITSPTGSVIRDIISVVNRRFPAGKLLLFQTNVQGESAVPSLIDAIRTLAKRKDVDLIIIARGGGSLEDLWCFNNEQLARAIFESDTPIISAIGHETDFTISDFVADRRAETPSAAAEMAFPDANEIYESLNFMLSDLNRGLGSLVELFSQKLDELSSRLDDRMLNLISLRKHSIQMLEAKLQATDVFELLQQGFSITTKQNGLRVKSIQDVEMGETLKTIINDGILNSELIKKVEK
jgi:exodeoxyribonuclease VII large subunit